MSNLTENQKAALCGSIRTTKYARNFVVLLRELAKNLYEKNTANFIDEFTASLSEELLEVMKSVLKDVDVNKPMDVEDKIKEVIHFVKSVEEVGFTIPVNPRADFVRRIYTWCEKNLNPQILLDFTTNRLMESGLIMVYRGHFFEYSLKNLLDEYFLNKDMSSYLNKEQAQANEDQVNEERATGEQIDGEQVNGEEV